jgi:arylsulfatase A-like enzyme
MKPGPWLLLGVICPFLTAAPAVRASERPNVVIVMTDDQGLGDFSFTGNPVLKTPHLDAFARTAVRFTDFHAAPMCSPTRGQLLTGLAALRNGVTSVTAGRTFLRPGLPTLAELFRNAGYTTGIFGKWHLGDSYPHRPLDKGFDESVCHLGWGQLASTPEAGWPLEDGRLFRNGRAERYRGHCTDVWFDEAKAWMKRQQAAGRPFLCYIPTNAPHGPHIDLERFIAPYRERGLPASFFGMIAHVDERFGDLDRFLTEEGLRDNTLVIFTTDNGGTAGVKTFNAGLRAGKATLYEGGHRVPCWIRWPAGGLGSARDIDVPVQNTDLLPTLCDLCGVPPPERAADDAPYAGTSLAGLLRGRLADMPERTLVVQYGQTPTKHDACVIRGRWRLVKGGELYDVHADRSQARDIANDRPEIVAQLRSDYETWWDGVAATLDDFVPQSLGAEQEPVVELTSGDWENIYADNVGFVRQAVGGPTGGTWHVRVERPGRYEFAVRRWPPRAAAPLGGDAPALAGIASQSVPRVFPGIAAAHVEIGGVRADAAADPTAPVAIVTTTLAPGTTRLKAWFTDRGGQPLCGAFFVTVRRLD